MEKSEPISLKKGQKISNVDLSKAENGIIVRYSIVTETGSNSERGWEDKSEVFTEAQGQEAVNRASELLKIRAGIKC